MRRAPELPARLVRSSFRRWVGLCFIFILCCSGLFQIGVARAASVILAWDANVETNLVGYKLYYGPVSIGMPSGADRYANVIDVGNATVYMVPGLVQGITYGFAVTAYNDEGKESELSPEVAYPRLPAVHLPPTLNPLSDVSLNEGHTCSVLLSGISGDLAGGALIVAASSSNPQLIPGPVVTYSSPGPTGELKLSVLPKSSLSTSLKRSFQSGPLPTEALADAALQATITVTVSQRFQTGETLQTERSFLATVKPPAEPLKITSFKMIQDYNASAGAIQNGLQLTWRSEPGSTYRVLYKTDLTQAAWMQLSPNATATTTNTSWVDWLPANGSAARRFYIVEMVPQTGVTTQSSFKLKAARAAAGDGLTLTWDSLPGLTYRVLYKSTLAEANWSVLSDGINAAAATTTWTDAAGLREPSRFYKVEAFGGFFSP